MIQVNDSERWVQPLSKCLLVTEDVTATLQLPTSEVQAPSEQVPSGACVACASQDVSLVEASSAGQHPLSHHSLEVDYATKEYVPDHR